MPRVPALGVWRCLNRRDSAFGYPAEILAQFGKQTRLLDQFVFKFGTLRTSEDCKTVVATIQRTIESEYGPVSEVEPALVSHWRLGKGVTIRMIDLCLAGQVLVSLQKEQADD